MKRLLTALGSLLGLASPSPSLAAAPPAETYFVFAKIQDHVMPIERGDKYEDPLAEALEKAGYGEVTGGGSQLGEGNSIAWVGIDIELVNLDTALEFTRMKLRQLGAPPGSVLEFERDGKTITIPIHDSEKTAEADRPSNAG